jgi:uncharacterized protein with PhoU and TrkA domain
MDCERGEGATEGRVSGSKSEGERVGDVSLKSSQGWAVLVRRRQDTQDTKHNNAELCAMCDVFVLSGRVCGKEQDNVTRGGGEKKKRETGTGDGAEEGQNKNDE